MKKIDVCDVTLRVSVEQLKKDLSFREKLSISKNLEKMGVTAIELPSILDKKEESVICKTIAESVENSILSVACQSEKQVNEVYDCIKNAKNACVQIVYPVSTVQMEYVYHAKAPKMLEKIANAIKGAKQTFENVEFIALDATRAEDGFVVECAKTAFENGATTITLCDDGGVYFPDQFAALVKQVKSACDIKVYVQPSDKLKMAASTAVEVIKAGADGVKTAIGAPEYLAPDVLCDILRAKGDELGVCADLDFTVIHKTVSAIQNVSEKASGGVERTAYKDSLTLGAECTLKDICDEIVALGYELSAEDNGKVYEEFKRVCSKKGAIGERELEAIVASTAMQVPTTYHLVNYVVNSGNIITATANVTLEKDGVQMSGVSTGDGPIDAAFHAIEQTIGHHYELDDFNIQAVTKGREAVGSAIIRLRAEGKLYSGNGVSTDIVGACIRAYINALNKIVYSEN